MNNDSGLNKLITDIREIAHRYRTKAAIQLNAAIVDERWEIGKRIVEEEQNGSIRAEYGTNLLKELSKLLTVEMGKGYSPRALAYYRQLYLYFPDRKILQTRLQNLSWSHIQAVLGEKDERARLWYMGEAVQQMWSAKVLERNIGSQYYHRLLASYDKEAVEEKNKDKYKDALKRQYRDLMYTIENEDYDGDNAKVTVKITVYDFYKAQKNSNDYLNSHKDEFLTDGVYDASKYVEYKLKQMSDMTDTISYNVVFKVKKNNNKWEVEQPDDEVLEKLHGVYNYEEK